MLETVTIIVAAGTMLVLAVAMSLVLGWANRAFHVEVDPRIDAIGAALPGANCGGCGFVGCGEYAEAVVKDGAGVDMCPPGGAGAAAAIGEIMGIKVETSAPKRPVVYCGATHDKLADVKEYQGEKSCSAGNIISGLQSCTYGCLGLGDCVTVCAYDAIKVVNGLAVVDYDNCIGCSACAKACPRNLIKMVPFKGDRVVSVRCSNLDFGADVKRACKVGCIGCKGCTRAMPELFAMEGHLAKVNLDKFEEGMDITPAQEKCPTKCIDFEGKG